MRDSKDQFGKKLYPIFIGIACVCGYRSGAAKVPVYRFPQQCLYEK